MESNIDPNRKNILMMRLGFKKIKGEIK